MNATTDRMNSPQFREKRLEISHTRRGRSAAPCRAFTLIELLMVISIISLLMAILMPALGRAKKTASQTTCQASMFGMGTALQTYLAAFDNSMPMNGVILPKPGGSNTAPTIGFGSGDPNPQHWDLPYGVLWDYMSQSRKGYICNQDAKDGMMRSGVSANQLPLQRDPANGTISVGPGPNGFWSYSVNSVLNSEGQFRRNFFPKGGSSAATQQPWIDPVKWTTLGRTSDFIVFVEEDVNSPFNDEVFDAPAYNGGDKLTNRHNNGGNVAFADRHVEWMSDVLFNQAPSAGSGPNQDNWTALQYPITRDFFPDGGAFASPP